MSILNRPDRFDQQFEAHRQTIERTAKRRAAVTLIGCLGLVVIVAIVAYAAIRIWGA